MYICNFVVGLAKRSVRSMRKIEGDIEIADIDVFSSNTGKYGPEKTPYLDTFHAVLGFVSFLDSLQQTSADLSMS